MGKGRLEDRVRDCDLIPDAALQFTGRCTILRDGACMGCTAVSWAYLDQAKLRMSLENTYIRMPWLAMAYLCLGSRLLQNEDQTCGLLNLDGRNSPVKVVLKNHSAFTTGSQGRYLPLCWPRRAAPRRASTPGPRLQLISEVGEEPSGI